jgi:hypothetical protein
MSSDKYLQLHDVPQSLQLLLPDAIRLAPLQIRDRIRAFHPDLAAATVQADPALADQGTPLILVRWGRHTVRIVGFDAPMPAAVIESCVPPAHYGKALKQRARAHQAHALLFYDGDEPSPLERYAALATVAMALAPPEAFILNEAAHTSLPVSSVAAAVGGGDRLERLRSLPLLMLYLGFVKYEVEGQRGVWMRTHGGQVLGLPDLAMLAPGHSEGQKVFEILDRILSYVLVSGAAIEPGHTIEAGPGQFLRFRAPAVSESYLQSEFRLLVAETISENQINR